VELELLHKDQEHCASASPPRRTQHSTRNAARAGMRAVQRECGGLAAVGIVCDDVGGGVEHK
jgi:hypothetical protein